MDTADYESYGGSVPAPGGSGQLGLIEEIEDNSYGYCYWRQPNGWITVAPAWGNEFKRLSDEGWTALRRYGEFLLANAVVNTQGKRIGTWRVGEDPYRQILLKGGAKEFAVEQILEHGWHRKAPYGARFSQLADLDHTDVICQHCRKPFLSEGDLRRHESIIHSDTSKNDALSRGLADAMSNNPLNLQISQLFAAMMERMERAEQRQAEQAEQLAKLVASIASKPNQAGK